jgi:hypothetical protein
MTEIITNAKDMTVVLASLSHPTRSVEKSNKGRASRTEISDMVRATF